MGLRISHSSTDTECGDEWISQMVIQTNGSKGWPLVLAIVCGCGHEPPDEMTNPFADAEQVPFDFPSPAPRAVDSVRQSKQFAKQAVQPSESPTPATGAQAVLPESPPVVAIAERPPPEPVDLRQVQSDVGPIESLSLPDTLLMEDEVRQLKRDVRTHLRRLAGRSVRSLTVPRGTVANWSETSQLLRAATGDPPKLAYMIVQQLEVADKLLVQDDPHVRASALGVIREVCLAAQKPFQQQGLAPAICDAWLMPNLSAASSNPLDPFSRRRVLAAAVGVYYQAERPDSLLHAARLLLQVAIDRPSADVARYRIAEALEKQGKYAEAISYLEQISDRFSMRFAKQRIPELRAKLEAPTGSSASPASSNGN